MELDCAKELGHRNFIFNVSLTRQISSPSVR
jgi:hypothetical protein